MGNFSFSDSSLLSSRILWPLFHYLPGEINFDEAHWDAYVEANHLFAEAVCKVAKDGDLIWIQDCI